MFVDEFPMLKEPVTNDKMELAVGCTGSSKGNVLMVLP
jgi:hypothetical protein